MNIYAIHDKKADFIVSIFAQVNDAAAVHAMRQLYATADVPLCAVRDTELLAVGSYNDMTGMCFGTLYGQHDCENEDRPRSICDLVDVYLDVKSDDLDLDECYESDHTNNGGDESPFEEGVE